MTDQYCSNVARLFDSFRAIAAALVVAAIAASCSSGGEPAEAAPVEVTEPIEDAEAAPATDPTPVTVPPAAEQDAPDEVAPIEQVVVPDPVDLGDLEATSGPGSLVLAAGALMPASLGESWISLPASADDTPASCSYSAPVAQLTRSFAQIPTPDEIAATPALQLLPDTIVITIEIHADSGSADARSEGRAGDPGRQCLVDMLDQLDAEQLNPSGFFEISSDDAEGRLVDPSIERDTARGWRGDGRVSGPGFDEPLIVAEDWFTSGRVYVSLATQAFGDPTEILRNADRALGAISIDAAPQEAEVDRAIDVLRRVVATDVPEAPFFTSITPAETRPPREDLSCNARAAGVERAQLSGPFRSTVSSSSALVQQSSWMATAEIARAEVEAVFDLDDACLLELVAAFPGDIAIVDRAQSVQQVGDHEVAFADLLLTQTLAAGDNEIVADLRWQLALTTREEFVTGWQFIGLAGDEPDLLVLAAESGGRLVAAIEATSP